MILGASQQTENMTGAVPIRITKFTDSNGLLSYDLANVPKTTTWDESLTTCKNALMRLSYTLKYNHTTIVDVSVEIETIDVNIATSEIKQEFAITFIPVEADFFEQSHGQNNIIARKRSGNPGYIAGDPTLGARSPSTNTTLSYVAAQKAGFTVMDTGMGGRCSSSSQAGTVSQTYRS